MKETNSEEESIYLEAPINIITKIFSILTIMNFSKLSDTDEIYLMYNPQIDETLFMLDDNENKSIKFSQSFYVYDKQNNKSIKKYMTAKVLYKDLYKRTDKELLNIIERLIINIKEHIKQSKENFLKQ